MVLRQCESPVWAMLMEGLLAMDFAFFLPCTYQNIYLIEIKKEHDHRQLNTLENKCFCRLINYCKKRGQWRLLQLI